MSDTVTTETVFDGLKRKIVHWTSVSDGTGESGVTKVDISALTFAGGQTPTYTVIDRIDYDISGMTVRLYWDHTADDEIAILPDNSGSIDFWAMGGKADPQSTGGTGDILLTTNGQVDGSTYDIRLFLRPKA
jgi:hypothetical protein